MKYARIFVPLASNLVLLIVLQGLNDLLAPFSMSLRLDALYLLFSALYLRFHQGFLVVFFTALVIDAGTPLPYGFSLIVFTIILALVIFTRTNLRRERGYHVAFTAMAANLVILVMISIIMGRDLLLEVSYWQRVLADIFISELAVAVLAYSYVHLQRVMIYHLGTDLSAELQRI